MKKEHGIKGTDLNFESKMSSLGNVVFIDRRIMDVVFLISLTHKKFFTSPPPPHSCLFLVLLLCIFQAVDCPHLCRQYIFNESFSLYLYWIFRV